MFKKIFFFLSGFFFSTILSAQAPSLRLGVLKGVACAPCAYLIENKSKLAVQNIAFKVFDTPHSELPKLLRGELDAGFLSPKDAAKVFSAGKGSVVALGVAQNGNLFLLTNDEAYADLEDLRGKSVFCNENEMAGADVFKYILSKKGLKVLEKEADDSSDSVRIDFSVPAASLANKLILGEANYALVAEPFASVALKNSPKTVRATSLQRLYSAAEDGTSLPAMLLVVRADFAAENRDLIRRFTDVYKSAVSWTSRNPAKAASLAEKHKIGLPSSVAKSAISNAALVWRDSSTAKSDLEKLYSILQVELPAEDFYFKK